jgi:hypothetical protein
MTADKNADSKDKEKKPAPEIRDKRKVDETWKEEAAREKQRLADEAEKKAAEAQSADEAEGAEGEQGEYPPPSFLSFISGFAAQVLIQLGEIKNPMTNQAEIDFFGAKYAIDTLTILHEKTKGNLTPEEERYFDAMMTDLKMRFVRALQRAAAEAQGQGGPKADDKTKPKGN